MGVIEATGLPITETNQFLGRIRIEAINRVNVVARVTGFLDERLFTEGAEVKKGGQLYHLERAPFEADLASKQAVVAQLQATLTNATLTTDRARTLLGGPAGQQSTYAPRTCQRWGSQPRLIGKILDPRKGQTIRVFKCQCGELTRTVCDSN